MSSFAYNSHSHYNNSASGPAPPSSSSNPYHNNSFAIHSQKHANNLSNSSTSKKSKVKLHETSEERDRYDNMAELYSLILTTEKLERAYVKDSIKTDEYAQACDDLIAKFKTFKHILGDINIEQFMAQYKMNCPAAYNRLCLIGVNATVEHGSGEKNNSGYIVLETTQHFITAMDSLRLNMRSVDELQPLMKVLVEALNKQSMIEFPAKRKMLDWLRDLNGMRASDELDEHQVRQLLHDLDNAYNEYGGEIKKNQGS
eukprot:CAMPEP_0117444416 /NCGR_PEP_ID=MMETSP0759-20121206/5230_1 /TAXON_ID=63605 /ORGANISM="Percolomonas cosmopolitus, Strain WS" /LENGTH=256 /DNA_ID=CAMNT_0005236483 /DNA_START=92 /DNA_END=862 /DNA_ORIENTATION=+